MFTVATYNVLADAYVRRELYPRVPPERFEPARRRAAVVARVAGLGADVLCLQEVEPPTAAALDAALTPLGYAGGLALKPGRPDGCAVYLRPSPFGLDDARTLTVEEPGHVDHVRLLRHEGRRLGVVCTHLRWQAPDAPPEQQYGTRQARRLLAALADAGPCDAWVVCGDLNADAASPVLRLFFDFGLRDAYAARPDARTCVADGRARRIDFLLHGPALNAEPLPPPPVDDASALPSETEPSDHLPPAARFAWADAPLPASAPPR